MHKHPGYLTPLVMAVSLNEFVLLSVRRVLPFFLLVRMDPRESSLRKPEDVSSNSVYRLRHACESRRGGMIAADTSIRVRTVCVSFL